MKRFLILVALITLGPSRAGHSVSFVVAGHRVTVEAPRDCHSPSCVLVSIPGIHRSRDSRGRHDDDDDASDAAATAKPPAAMQRGTLSAIVEPASEPAAGAVASTRPPAGTPDVAPPPRAETPPPGIQLPKPLQPEPLPVTSSLPAPSADDKAVLESPPASAPRPVQVLQEADDDPFDAPLGDWQSEGNKGSVRIERCGRALCGYVLDPASNASGEAARRC